jgi:hypothetical protein
MISSGSTGDSPHLVTAYTATLCVEDFDLDTVKDEITPKNVTFLKSVEDRCDLSDAGQKERYNMMRNQVLDRVKRLLTSSPSHNRRLSISSNGSSSLNRDWNASDDENDSEDNPSTKPRVNSPPKIE